MTTKNSKYKGKLNAALQDDFPNGVEEAFATLSPDEQQLFFKESEGKFVPPKHNVFVLDPYKFSQNSIKRREDADTSISPDGGRLFLDSNDSTFDCATGRAELKES